MIYDQIITELHLDDRFIKVDSEGVSSIIQDGAQGEFIRVTNEDGTNDIFHMSRVKHFTYGYKGEITVSRNEYEGLKVAVKEHEITIKRLAKDNEELREASYKLNPKKRRW